MRVAKYLLLGAAIASIGACSDDDGGVAPLGPAAMVRFVNASPDAGTVNVLFVDELTNLPSFQGVPFRGTTGLYQRVDAGDRDIRVFFNTTDVDSAKVRLIDETVSLEAGQFYTFVYGGTVAGDADQLMVMQETVPDDAAAGSIAVKVLHAASTLGAVDVYAADSALNPMTTPAATFAGLAFGEASGYQNMAALAGTSLYEFAVAPAGGAAASFSTSPNSPGAAKDGTISAQAGVRQGGSVLTAVVMPGAVAGSRAARTSGGVQTNANPVVVILLDNIPGT